ncbi:hypothetical protein V8J82_15810 [Gymnodinialimonas sp. 2305UL16-5]
MNGNTTLFITIATGLVTVGAGLLAALVVLLAPGYRRALEPAGLALVLQAIIERSLSGMPIWDHVSAFTWISFFAIFYAIAFALERDFLRSAGLKMTYHARATRKLNATPAAIWAAIAPSQETMRSYWTGSLTRVDARPDWGPEAYEVHFRLGAFGTLVQRHVRTIWDWPHRFSYDYAPVDDVPRRAGVRGRCKAELAKVSDDQVEVATEDEIIELGFGTWSLLWLDDSAQSDLDALQARLSGRRDWSIAGWSARKMAMA